MSYFRSKGVTTVVRLNKKMYESDRFTAHGVKHHEMYFPDGTCPSEPILYRFLETVEKEPGALAVSRPAGGAAGHTWAGSWLLGFAFTHMGRNCLL